MFNSLKNKVSDTLKHAYVRNTLLGLFFVSSIPFIPILMIADEFILLTNYLFKKEFNTFIKQSQTKLRKISIKDIFSKTWPFQAVFTIYSYLFSLAFYADSKNKYLSIKQRKEARELSSIFAIIGIIAASSPIIIYLGLKFLAPIENLSHQVNIKHLYSTFNNLTYGLSSYSLINKLKKYFFFDQFEENIYKNKKLNINIFNDIAKALVPNNTSKLADDTSFEILLNMLKSIDEKTLQEIADCPTTPSESIFLCLCLLAKNQSTSLNKSKNEFLDILLTNPVALNLSLETEVLSEFFKKINIAPKKRDNWSKDSRQKLGNLLDQNRLNYLFDRIDSSDVVDFINSLVINSVISINHDNSEYIFIQKEYIGGREFAATKTSLKTPRYPSARLQLLIQAAYFIFPNDLGDPGNYGNCTSISHTFEIKNTISAKSIFVTIKNNQEKASTLCYLYRTSENINSSKTNNNNTHPHSFLGSQTNLEQYHLLKQRLLDDIKKYQSSDLFDTISGLFKSHDVHGCFNDEKTRKYLHKNLSSYLHPDRRSKTKGIKSNPDLENEFTHYYQIVNKLKDLSEKSMDSQSEEPLDKFVYQQPILSSTPSKPSNNGHSKNKRN